MAFMRGLLSGVATGAAAADKYIVEEGKAQREFDRKMTLEEFAAAKRMEAEQFRESYMRDIADQKMAIEVSEGVLDRESRERIAKTAADTTKSKSAGSLSQFQIDAVFDQVAPSIEMIFPDAFGADEADWKADGTTKQPKSVKDYMRGLAKIVKDRSNPRWREATVAYQMLQQFQMLKASDDVTNADLTAWAESFGTFLMDDNTESRSEFDYANQDLDAATQRFLEGG